MKVTYEQKNFDVIAAACNLMNEMISINMQLRKGLNVDHLLADFHSRRKNLEKRMVDIGLQDNEHEWIGVHEDYNHTNNKLYY